MQIGQHHFNRRRIRHRLWRIGLNLRRDVSVQRGNAPTRQKRMGWKMKEYEAYRAIADVQEMCEGTNVCWVDCFKSQIPFFMGNAIQSLILNMAEPAIEIIEDKPVFAGDKLWVVNPEAIGFNQQFEIYSVHTFKHKASWSWNPPKPKTVMVEMPIGLCECYANSHCIPTLEYEVFVTNCKTALGNLK